ncbi:sigma factor regulator VreR [Aliidongia dinghuensis]|uniref:Sigma factor regulator VreR n=1 Tax=Aliidongia dinghuensis TaxID=1867774 RepID=A0A8J2Z1G1_9PROT|nr:FecR domain-containing protein [Aliidongia dinghuensis]GGF51577.1 sigma factor regulator VreR [Aliidongia dinghuensis]
MSGPQKQHRLTATGGEAPGRGNEAINLEAMAWVMRLTSGEATAADAEALNRWRAQSQTHRRAFAEANLLWDKLGPAAVEMVSRAGKVVPLARQQGVGQQGARQQGVGQQGGGPRLGRRALLGGTMAAAAAAAGYAIVRPPFALWPSFADLAADYRTGKGEQRRITLAGTVSVELNTETSIALRPGAGEESRIELISGEAAIAASGPRAAPFVVLAGAGHVAAANARFNVRLDGSTVRVTCLEGTVQATCRGRAATIQANQQIVYGEPGLSQVAAVDPEVVSAWQQGLLVFRYMPFDQVVEEINRYRPGRIIVMNAELKQRSVVANFRLDRLDQAIDQLAGAFGAHVTSLPEGIVLLS